MRILELNDDSALLETRDGYRRIRVGDESPEIGKIISIRRMADYWIVVASTRSLAQRAPVADDPADGDGPRRVLELQRQAGEPKQGFHAPADLLDAKNFVGGAAFGDGARHAPDGGAGLILSDDMGARALEPEEAPGAVIAHAGQHDREHGAAISGGGAFGQNVDARLVEAFALARRDVGAVR